MSEWWTYRPADFLMFSPRLYWRLFASVNEAWWPAPLVVVALALAWLARARALRSAAGALAAAWVFVAWAFHWQRFAPINWAAEGFAPAFALQAALLASIAAAGGLHAAASRRRQRAGLGLLLWALLGHPLLAPAFGRPWIQAELFGFAPDPTAIATLGWLLLVQAQGRARIGLRLAWMIPSLWLVLSAATLATMGSWQAVVPLAALAASCLARMSIPDLRSRDPARLR